jgi:hypothetical protein
MSLEYVKDTGDTGQLKIVDWSMNPRESGKIVELWIRSTSPVAIPQLPYSYIIDGTSSGVKSFNFKATTLWQRVAMPWVGYAQTIDFKLGKTNTSQLAGPTSHLIELYSGASTVLIKVGTQYKRAQPYVRKDGIWRPATAMTNVGGTWKETV